MTRSNLGTGISTVKMAAKFEILTHYSIKRGELFPINVTAFNKLNQRNLPLKIKILDSEEIKLGNNKEIQICLNSQDSQTESFSLKAKELEEVNITVEAKIESFKGCDLGKYSHGHMLRTFYNKL